MYTEKIIVTVDIAVVINRREIVLIRRAEDPFKGCLAMSGGHVESTDASLAQAAARELREEVSLDFDVSRFSPLMTLDRDGADPRPGKRISHVFVLHVASLSEISTRCAASDAASLHVCDLATLAEQDLAFDHFDAILVLRS